MWDTSGRHEGRPYCLCFSLLTADVPLSGSFMIAFQAWIMLPHAVESLRRWDERVRGLPITGMGAGGAGAGCGGRVGAVML